MENGDNNNFISYVKKQKPVDFIVISSDEEDNDDQNVQQQEQLSSQSSPSSPEEQQSKKRKIEHYIESIKLDNSEEGKTSPKTFDDLYSLSCEDIFEKQRISFLATLDQVSKAYSINSQQSLLTVTATLNSEDIKTETETLMVNKPDLEIIALDTACNSPSSTASTLGEDNNPELPALYNIPNIPSVESTMDIPNSIRINTLSQTPTKNQTCIIPNNLSTKELLNMLEIYMFSLTSEPTTLDPATTLSSRSMFRRAARTHEANNSELLQKAYPSAKVETQKPYTPNKVWFNSTWEDWAQLDPGDVLHVPFSKEEIHVLEYHVNKHVARGGKNLVDFWIYVSSMLPGRTRLDCKWFWIDYTSGLALAHTNPVMIRHYKRTLASKNRNNLLKQRHRNGYMVRHIMKQLHWENMTKESTIPGGSGDAITVAVFKDDIQGVRVAAGSLCDENVQYNMPGNLRLWDSASKKANVLFGHQTESSETQQAIWRTVADVKVSHEGDLFFSGSHDGTTKVWRQSTGRLVSTLQYHCKPVNQLAVSYWTPGNVLASCSNDGTATIWNIGVSGKTGEGAICELDAPFYKNPAVECLEFGHHATHDLLFLGIYNRDVEHTGYIQAFDANTCQPVKLFDSMHGGVSAMTVSSSGQYIASGNYNRYDNLSGDKHLHLHDVRLNDVAKMFFTGHKDVNVVAISPCETFVASGSADKEKGEVVIFDVRFHTKPLHRLVHDQSTLNQSLIAPDSSIGIGGLHWMSDSRMVVTGGGDSTVKIWNIEGETKLVKAYPTTNCVTSLFVNEECMTIAAGVAGADGIVHVWQP
ncbi:hypothetical protein G6F46_001194 [Rhizopus delemar]|uniref:Guanine nucleotide-binding protein subunit beta-like protein n=2 Tax=Rhizopus TaxID=4842 RepID=A0A9P7CSV1_9FUNG|nr:hypothetical protein G6F55_001872 [Rhizopus delemar]KAG1549481.1 hypothetical protein G6F51_003030 [Rhizopus arrhizus]KAG1493052.1 hypothetical protein G6F54_008863 [Rhizopus delemar]KAG1515966.1 hypothetical protein G6F53_002519 [Rhizopus delemar]KAG1522281.1 hypothetical protein G6F52_006000 [Rhizopus delemar]